MATSLLPRNILFPTDFSKSSEAIIGHVVGLASAFNAKVWLLSVVPSLADFHGVSENYFGPLSDAALANLDRDRKLLETDRLRKLECLQKQLFRARWKVRSASSRPELPSQSWITRLKSRLTSS